MVKSLDEQPDSASGLAAELSDLVLCLLGQCTNFAPFLSPVRSLFVPSNIL